MEYFSIKIIFESEITIISGHYKMEKILPFQKFF